MTKRLKEIIFFPSDNKIKINTNFYFEEAAQIINLLPAFFGLTDDDFTASFPDREFKKRLKFIDKEIKFLNKKIDYYDNPRVSNDEFTKKYYFYSELLFSWQDKRTPFEKKIYIQEQIKRVLKDLEMLYLTKKCPILSEKWNGLETFIKPLFFLEALNQEYILYKDMVIMLNELQERQKNIQPYQQNTLLSKQEETPTTLREIEQQYIDAANVAEKEIDKKALLAAMYMYVLGYTVEKTAPKIGRVQTSPENVYKDAARGVTLGIELGLYNLTEMQKERRRTRRKQ